MLIQQSPKKIENKLDLIPKTATSFEKLQACLDVIKDIIGGCEIQGSEVITSNDVRIYVGETSRFTEQYSPIELHNFLTKCQKLAAYLLTQDFAEFETVIEESKRILKRGLPLFCHAYLCISSHSTQVNLVAVLDRLFLSGNTGSNALTILNGHLLDQLGSIERSREISVDKVNTPTLPSLSPTDAANGTLKVEVNPPEVEIDQLDPVKKISQALVEELKSFGTNFWVCHYLEDDAKLPLNGIRINHDEIKVIVSSGTLESNYVRALAWFGLGTEQNRNLLDLSFGTFLIIRSNQNAHLVAITKLDSYLL